MKMMRRIKARLVFLGVRQVEATRNLGIEPTRFSRILNEWIRPTPEEKAKIVAYMKERAASAA